MLLQKFSNELVDKILPQFTGDQERLALFRLALTCRALSNLVRPFLSRNLDIAPFVRTLPYTPEAATMKWAYLLRTLRGQPNLGTIVHSLKLLTGLRPLSDANIQDLDGSPWAMGFFNWFPNLSELWTTVPVLMALPIRSLPFRQTLTQLHLHGEKVTNLQILRFKDFSKLRLLQFTFLNFVRFEASAPGTLFINSNNVLQSLIFGDRALMCGRALEVILSRCLDLRVLKIGIPFFTKEHDTTPRLEYFDIFPKLKRLNYPLLYS